MYSTAKVTIAWKLLIRNWSDLSDPLNRAPASTTRPCSLCSSLRPHCWRVWKKKRKTPHWNEHRHFVPLRKEHLVFLWRFGFCFKNFYVRKPPALQLCVTPSQRHGCTAAFKVNGMESECAIKCCLGQVNNGGAVSRDETENRPYRLAFPPHSARFIRYKARSTV